MSSASTSIFSPECSAPWAENKILKVGICRAITITQLLHQQGHNGNLPAVDQGIMVARTQGKRRKQGY